MATLIVIAIVLFLIFISPVVVVAITSKLLTNNRGGKHDFSLVHRSRYNRNDTVSLTKVGLVYKPILFIWLFATLIFGTIAVLLELSTSQRLSSDIPSSSLDIDLGIFPPLLLEISLIVSTITLASWWLKLRTSHVRNAATYAIALWILSRCVWFLPHPFVIDNLTMINKDLSDTFGNQALISLIATLACISATSALIAALLDLNPKIQWVLLALTAPFVTMFWILEQVSFALLFWDITYPAMIMGGAIWMSRQSMRLHFDFNSRHEQVFSNFSGLSLTVLALFSSSLVLPIRIFAYPQDQTNLLHSIIMPWLSILAASALFHIVARWKLKIAYSSSWAGAVFLICLAIVYFPEYDSWYPASINDNLTVYFPMDWHVLGIGLIGITALLISLYFGIWSDARSYMVGLCWPALLHATLSKPAEMIQIEELAPIYWVAPTLALVAVFVIMAGMFGPHKLRG